MSRKADTKPQYGPGLAAILARRAEPERIQKIGARKKPEQQVPALVHPVFSEARSATIEARTKRVETGKEENLESLVVDARKRKSVV